MTGTIVNAVAIAVGGLIGVLLKKGIKESYTQGLNKALGLAVLIIGLNGVISNMLTSENGKLSSSGELLLVVSLVIGTFTGEVLRFDDRFNKFCKGIESKFKSDGFASGFINGTGLFCVGAMAIIGSINDGLTGDSSVLFVKSALDFVTAIIFGTTLGYGVIFSSIPILIYQGGISLLAGSLSSVLQGELLVQICSVGYAIIMAIGFNFLLKDKFKTLNMVPSLLVPVAYHYIMILINYIRA